MSSELMSFITSAAFVLGAIATAAIACAAAYALARSKYIILEQYVGPKDVEYGVEPNLLQLALTKEVKQAISGVIAYSGDYQGPPREISVDIPAAFVTLRGRQVAWAKAIATLDGQVRLMYCTTEHAEEFTHPCPVDHFLS